MDIKSKYLNEIKIAMENSAIIMKRGKYRANSFDYDHWTGSQRRRRTVVGVVGGGG